MAWIEFFALRAIGTFHNAALRGALLSGHDDTYLSANLRLCGDQKMAHIESRLLASVFREVILDRLRKRYGKEFDLEIITYSTSDSKSVMKRIAADSGIIKKRLESDIFASNVSAL